MSGRKAKIQRKLERERFGTDTVAFKRGRTDQVVKARQDRVKHLVSLEMPSAAALAAAVSLGTRRADGLKQDVLDGALKRSKSDTGGEN